MIYEDIYIIFKHVSIFYLDFSRYLISRYVLNEHVAITHSFECAELVGYSSLFFLVITRNSPCHIQSNYLPSLFITFCLRKQKKEHFHFENFCHFTCRCCVIFAHVIRIVTTRIFWFYCAYLYVKLQDPPQQWHFYFLEIPSIPTRTRVFAECPRRRSTD